MRLSGSQRVNSSKLVRAWLAIILLTGVLVVSQAGTPRTAEALTPVGPPGGNCQIEPPSAEYAAHVSASPPHAQVWRLYQAFFLRQPEQSGFNYWLQQRSAGASLSTIAYQFATGPEFIGRYGNLSNAGYVDLVYANVLCRTPEQSGRQYWISLLASGSLSRWDMMVNFAELREYLGNTTTCHSIYSAESAATSGCPQSQQVPLAQASLAANGYQSYAKNVIRQSGSVGSMRAVLVDYNSGQFKTGPDRCSVASINANWLVASQKDRANPGVLGVGVIDGAHVKNSADRGDRGVFGLRFDPNPSSVSEVWPGDTLSPDDRRLNSIMSANGVTSLESWHSAAEESIYLSELAPSEIVAPSEWIWAAAGIPLILSGQVNDNFHNDFVNDPYTFQTLRHSFVMFDQNSDRLLFGATANLDARDLVNWAQANGYEDLIIFDGGGSTEFNVGGQAVVAGTPRDIPVWLGVGC